MLWKDYSIDTSSAMRGTVTAPGNYRYSRHRTRIRDSWKSHDFIASFGLYLWQAWISNSNPNLKPIRRYVYDSRETTRPPSFLLQLGALWLGGGVGGGSQLTHINELGRKRQREGETERKNRSREKDDDSRVHRVKSPEVNEHVQRIVEKILRL